MRISVDPRDSGYQPEEVTLNKQVYVNGVRVKYALTADTDLGYAIALDDNLELEPLIYPPEPKKYRIDGKVEIFDTRCPD